MTAHSGAPITIDSLPDDPDDPRFTGALDLRNRLHAERDPQLDPDTPEQFRRAVAGTETFEQELLLAIDADQVVGLAAVHLHRVGSANNIVELEIEVDPKHRRQGIGTALLQHALEVASRDGRTTCTSFGVHSDETIGFWGAKGAQLRSVEVLSRAWIADTDADLMTSWIERGLEYADIEAVEFFEGVTPPHLRSAAAELLNALNDAPTDELETEQITWTDADVVALDELITGRGRTKWTMLALGPGGAPIGYTALSLQHEKPRFAQQGVTTVGDAHRGKGVGRLLKALMWQRLRDHAPEVEAVDTDNAASNASMRKINEEMGYRPAIEWGLWQAPIPRGTTRSRGTT